MIVTADLLAKVGVRDPNLWAGPLDAACQANGITSAARFCPFAACILHETGGFNTLRESLNYSVASLLGNFGGVRRLRDGRKVFRITPEQAALYGRTPTHPANEVMIGNTIYGGPWGVEQLGNTKEGDGYLFRGGGPMQQTGRANYSAFGKKINWQGPIEMLPNYLTSPKGGCDAAAFFWRSVGCNELCDAGNVKGARVRVNGGEIGMDDFLNRYTQLAQLYKLNNAAVAHASAAPLSDSDRLNQAQIDKWG